ncbi:DNA-binding FadR family transcriptional regulator [Nakamurella sp. UYEF19]|uniref:FadR/GntR family transcriptional regulator n=1 Tax=Nakamurella sp. UYEF19 TaxID=1756392 RepID=UPI00339B1518
MTSRPSLADGLADKIINDVVVGRYAANVPLPSETELAEQSGVSRLTAREAIKTVAAKGVVRVEQGRGTFANPPAMWSTLDPVLFVARSAHGSDRLALPRQLIEARKVVEVAVAEMAAERRTDAHMAQLDETLGQMRAAAAVPDVVKFVEADMAFHQGIIEAANNSMIASLFDPISQILKLTRHQTSSYAPVRENAIADHTRILQAVRRGTATKAGRAMREHLSQTEVDMDRYVLNPSASLLAMKAEDFNGTPNGRKPSAS